jgi:hypothetical protein
MSIKKTKLRRALLDELIKGIDEVIKKHRCSLSKDEVNFLEQSITLLKEYKKSGKDSDINLQIVTVQVIEILLRFFLFSSDSESIEDIF